MKDNVIIIKELLVPLNMSQLIDLKNAVDIQLTKSIVEQVVGYKKAHEDFQKEIISQNIPVAKDVPQSIPPKAEPQKIVWKATSEKWAGRDARIDEEGWIFAENDPELSKFLRECGGASRVKLDGVEFDVKFSGAEDRFLSRSLPKDK